MSDEIKLELPKLKEYFCPIHGDMGTMHITVNDGKVERRFCLQCFREMLEDKCCELEEIKEDDL